MTKVASQTRECRTCGQPNELPFLFCAACGSPRVRLGRLRAMITLSLVLTAFMAIHVYGELFRWNWPVFAIYALFFIQFAEVLAKGRRRLVTAVWLWCSAVFAGAFAFIDVLLREGADTYIWTLAVLPQLARDQPMIFYPAAGAVAALVAVPAYMRWGQRYGWVSAYRLVLLALFVLAAAGFGACLVIRQIQTRQLAPAIQASLDAWVRNSMPLYVRDLNFVSLTAIRLFLFEVLVFAAVRGYAEAHRHRRPLDRERLARESGFTRSLVLVADAARQLALGVANMAAYIVSTLRVLAVDVWQITKTFTRELLGPTVALLTASVLLWLETRWTDAYTERNSLGLVLRLIGGVIGLVLCALVFLGCKSGFRWGRIFAFYTQLLGWLLPNLLLFFLILSLSLWGSSVALNQLDPDVYHLPFRLGPLTQAVGALLALLVVAVLIRKRSLLVAPAGAPPPAPTVAAPAPEPPAASPVETARERASLAGAGREVITRLLSGPAGVTRRALGRARIAAEDLGLDDVRERVSGTVKDWTLRLKGKPKAVEAWERARAALAEVNDRMRVLERTRATISPSTYETMIVQAQRDAKEAERELARLQVEIDRLRERNAAARGEIAVKRAALDAQRTEVDTLEAAGALDAREAKRRRRDLDIELEAVSLRSEALDRMEAFLTAEPRDAT